MAMPQKEGRSVAPDDAEPDSLDDLRSSVAEIKVALAEIQLAVQALAKRPA
jgi:hypothetical protein